MTPFITYAVLDPDKPGRFTSPFCSFLFQPVYIGKGTPERAANINKYLNGKSKGHAGRPLQQWLDLRKNQTVPVIEMDAASESGAFHREAILIEHFGLKCDRTGILLNARYGGDHGKMSEHTKELLSLLNQGENNPNWGKTWSKEQHAKWRATWESKDRTRTTESMKQTWAAKNRIYEIQAPDKSFTISDLTKFCSDHGLPLSTFRKALKTESGIIESKKRKSKVEGWIIKYLD